MAQRRVTRARQNQVLMGLANEALGELSRSVGLSISDETLAASEVVWRLLRTANKKVQAGSEGAESQEPPA